MPMRLRVTLAAVIVTLFMWSALFAFQRGRRGGFREYEEELVTPADAGEKTEWAFARLKYPSPRYWNWTTDYPKADRQFVQGVRRLTRLHTRSVEQVVDVDSDEIYNWPWIYAVEVGRWDLTDPQCERVRDYLLRGGFLMVDDFHGTQEWAGFMASMSRIFPNRAIVEIENKDPIFHVLYDLDERVQVGGLAAVRRGLSYERIDGQAPHWRGIYDDNNRLMVAICFNQDYGDAWEWADDPGYPEKMTGQAYRLGINYIIYAMTH